MKKRKYKRNCPSCNVILHYSTNYTLKRANENNSLCVSCEASKPRGKRIVKKTKYNKDCDGCGKIIYYYTDGSLQRSLRKKTLCVSCTFSKLRGKNKNGNGQITKFYKKCPKCNDIMYYSRIDILNSAIELDTMCRKCTHIGLKASLETRKRLSILKSGTGNHMYGLRGPNNPNWGSKRTEASKALIAKKARINMIKRIETARGNGFQLSPQYNRSSIPHIEKMANELGITDIQHAENGGEYHIKELGYYVDGYSKEKNIVIEYYEKWHMKYSKNVKRDKRRKKEIMEHLNLSDDQFIIIYEYQ